jgi:DNA excision repair protein ERCC-4
MPDFTEIIADDRERASGIFEHLQRFTDVRLRVERLPAGDYIIDDTVVFERKAAADFAASLFDARLFCQAKRLADQTLRGAFIIEGNATDWNKLCLRREALQGALLTLSLVFDLPVFRSQDINETSHLLVYAGRQFVRLRHRNAPCYRMHKGKRRRTRQLRLLATLPGVGADRAKRLLDHFGSIQACLTASPAELQEVSTIGPKTAEAIRELIGERISPLGSRVENAPHYLT